MPTRVVAAKPSIRAPAATGFVTVQVRLGWVGYGKEGMGRMAQEEQRAGRTSTEQPTSHIADEHPKAPTYPKRIKLALQGGGSHGAFTWGVIDRLLEHGGFEVEAVVGTSAGAVNAAVLAYGLVTGGADGGRERLSDFWHRAAAAGRFGPLQPTPLDRLFSLGNMNFSPL